MKSFYDYLLISTKKYSYRIRTVSPIDDISIDRMEYVLSKYDLVTIDGPKKTIMQTRPLDFVSMPAAEVYIVDIVTHIPLSPFIVQQELRHALNIPESFLIVRSVDDPNEIQLVHQEEQTASDIEAVEKGLSNAAMLNNPDYPEYSVDTGGPIAGDAYTKNFLKYLAKIKADREVIVPEIEPETRKMFDFLKNNPIDPEYYKDEPWVKPIAVKPGAKLNPPLHTSPYDNFNDSIKNTSHVYADKDGENILITAKKV